MSQQTFVDRKTFEEYILSNGMKVYYHPDNSIVSTIVTIIIPLGHLSNYHFQNGATHFFEHVTLNRSERYPNERGGLLKKIRHEGGGMNAITDPQSIKFEASIPVFNADLQKDMVRQIFYPILREDDVDHERNIILAEKREAHKWTPFESEQEKLLCTYWLNTDLLTLEEMLGSEEDIFNTSLETLQEVQSYFFTPEVQVVASGQTITPLLEELDQIPTPAQSLPQKQQYVRWANSPNTVIESSENTEHKLIWGGYLPGAINNERAQAMYILNMLLSKGENSILFQEYRDKRGLIYYPYFHQENKDNGILFWAEMAIGNPEAIETVRAEIDEVLPSYIKDKDFLEYHTEEIINILKVNRAWNAIDRVDEAVADLKTFGRIIPINEDIDVVHKYANPDYLLSFLDQLSGPKTVHVTPIKE